VLGREIQTRRCTRCGAAFVEQAGLPHLLLPGWEQMAMKQHHAWRFFEQRLGRDDLLKLPAEASTRALLDWLRAVLLARVSCCQVLEIGAGCGWAARRLAEDGHRVIASDVRHDERLGLSVPGGGDSARWFGYVLADALALPFRAESFDCVYCFATLRHIADLGRLLSQIGRVLRPDGIFVALQDPYRGVLTTQPQGLQGSPSSMLARGWESRWRADPASQAPIRTAGLGSILYEVCRRAPSCLDAAAAAGLRAWVLPVPLALALQPGVEGEHSTKTNAVWLRALADGYFVDGEQLQNCVDRAEDRRRRELLSQLLGHCVYVGNTDGVLLGTRAGEGRFPLPLPCAYPSFEGATNRQPELLLLACARQGFVPVYGLYPLETDVRGSYCWAQPQVGLLVSPGPSVQITIAVPSSPWLSRPLRMEIRVEDETSPRAVFAVAPGKTVALRLPLRETDVCRSSLLLRLTAGSDFVPSDRGGSSDTRLLAYQLRAVQGGVVGAESLQAFLTGQNL
jgi:SAM-dependent methyltransferase